MAGESKIIGIDLGTTNSVVAVIVGTEPEVIQNLEGANKTPSVVAFLDDDEVAIGEVARRQAATNPARTITSVKRLMGRGFDEINESGETFPFRLVDHDGELLVDVDGMGYRPEQVSALILKRLKESAEAYLNEEVTQAVITVPAYFDDLQRQATIDAAEMAGLEVLRLINEPTAAAMAYGLGRSTEEDEIVAVYDFGGGTFDVSLLEISGKTFEVLTSLGDTQLGGDDLDRAIADMIIAEFEEDHGVDLTQDPVTLRRLKEVAERAKCELSAANQATMALPFIAYRDKQPLHLDRVITREEFEDLVDDFVRRTIRCCKRALEDANLSKSDVSKVILVGGTTRIPLVQDSVEDFFDQAPFKGVNPDEVVALGAATQAGVFEGNVQEVVLLDVTPHTLGIEVEGGKYSRIIDKNATIPIKAAKTFTTTEDDQSFVTIHVLQGESDDVNEDRSLGRFNLQGIPSATAGTPRIRVTFFINADGVVEISAEDMNTGQAEGMTIVHSDLTGEEKKKRSRRRQRRRRTSKPERRGGRGTARKTPSERPFVEGRSLEGDASAAAAGNDRTPSDSGVRPLDETAEERKAFAVLGDAAPGEGGVRAQRQREAAPSLKPVDYSEAPPTYSSFPSPVPPAQKRPTAPTAEAAPAAEQTPAASAGYQDPRTEELPYDAHDTMHIGSRGGDFVAATGDDADGEEPTEIQWQVPPAVSVALELAEKGDDNSAAQGHYTRALEELGHVPDDARSSFAVLRAQVLITAMAGQQEECRAALGALRDGHAAHHGEELAALHDRALSRFGTPALMRDRGRAKELLGDFTGATEDFEQAMRQEPQESDRGDLERLYRRRLEKGPDPQAQFKLVKILLKNNEVDEAVEVLQTLQEHPNYETRALKILGLCHWQKNMHYMAWQKFKSLPVDNDLQDILYRLASDMEGQDQLHNAAVVLEHLVETAPGYRDAEARLRKINYRLKLQQEEANQHKDVPVLSRDSRFTILEEINRGSMGIIFKAQDKTLNEIVALKVLNDYLGSDPAAVERFKSEARAAKRLSHPYIVRIHDFFENDNKRFLSMEYIEGTDLKRLFAERTTFTEDMILFYLVQICDALGYAHKLGIIHRDVKPANIMITSQNSVKITDFGIAKILQGEDATKSGTAVIGTPLYMAPEQIIGESVDGRTDIYALGIMLYEMVSGNPPFYLGNIEYHHIHTAPPALPDNVSGNLRTAIMKMIAKSPGDRFQSVEEIMPALRAGAV